MNIATLFALTIIILNEYVDKNDAYLLFLIKSWHTLCYIRFG